MEVTFKRLELGDTIKPIHSTDQDLNEFLRDDALTHIEDAEGITYMFENEDETICYCTILHDRISYNESDKALWNKLTKKVQRHRYRSYPAIKIGKLATSEQFERQGFARRIIGFVQTLYTRPGQLAGCRFLTVDAENKPDQKAINFYLSRGFKFLTENDVNDETRYMAYDLKNLLQ